MENNRDINAKARRHLKKYRIACMICVICTILLYLLIRLLNNPILNIVTTLLFIFLLFFVSALLFKKYILSIINKDLDPDTFLAAIYRGKLGGRNALWQLNGEYFCGNYQNVVSICNSKLADRKMGKRFKYNYLICLANVYFDIGDDENLRKIIERYTTELAKENPKKQEKYNKRFPRMEFYKYYLNRDIDACIAWVNEPTAMPLTQYHRVFCKARLALMQGNTEEATNYYKVLAKEVPQLNYGKLAANVLALQENTASEAAHDSFKITDEPAKVTYCYPKWTKAAFIIGICLLLWGIVEETAAYFADLKAEREFRQELAAYQEDVRVLVEKDHDDVVIIDTFLLSKGDDVIDSMFLCKTDKDIIVGCNYSYDGESEMFYRTMGKISLTSVSKDESPIGRCSFNAVTSDNRIESYFYTEKEDLPTEYYHLSTFEINGKTVYYVVTGITPNITNVKV